MTYYWNVFYNDEYIGTVRDFSSDGACHQMYMKTGGGSAYSGRSSKLYKAVRVQKRAKSTVGTVWRPLAVKKRTSIGQSPLSRPSNKHKRRNWKKYRGQGR